MSVFLPLGSTGWFIYLFVGGAVILLIILGIITFMKTRHLLQERRFGIALARVPDMRITIDCVTDSDDDDQGTNYHWDNSDLMSRPSRSTTATTYVQDGDSIPMATISEVHVDVHGSPASEAMPASEEAATRLGAEVEAVTTSPDDVSATEMGAKGTEMITEVGAEGAKMEVVGTEMEVEGAEMERSEVAAALGATELIPLAEFELDDATSSPSDQSSLKNTSKGVSPKKS